MRHITEWITPTARLVLACLVIIVVGCAARPSLLYANEARPVRQLHYEFKTDLVMTGIMAGGYLMTYAFEKDLAPESCRWCGVNSFDDWGHRNLMWSNTGAAETTSHITAFGLAPIIAFGLDAFASQDADSIESFPVDALIIAESTAAAAMFTQIVKFSAGRQRPAAHYSPAGSASPRDNTSFFSGHTSIAFALAVSSGTVATMRGYRLAPLIWGSGLAVAATTAYLRVAADRHYLTDVIAGAVIGSAFGFGIPYLFHRPRGTTPRVMLSATPYQDGGVVSIGGCL